jgi:hypothetical protein
MRKHQDETPKPTIHNILQVDTLVWALAVEEVRHGLENRRGMEPPTSTISCILALSRSHHRPLEGAKEEILAKVHPQLDNND